MNLSDDLKNARWDQVSTDFKEIQDYISDLNDRLNDIDNMALATTIGLLKDRVATLEAACIICIREGKD